MECIIAMAVPSIGKNYNSHVFMSLRIRSFALVICREGGKSIGAFNAPSSEFRVPNSEFNPPQAHCESGIRLRSRRTAAPVPNLELQNRSSRAAICGTAPVADREMPRCATIATNCENSSHNAMETVPDFGT